MSRKQTVKLYEYSRHDFEHPLPTELAVQLSKKAEELLSHTRSKVFEPVYRSNKLVGIRSFQFVGVVQINSHLSIQILPKMSESEGAQMQMQQSVQNLLYMMQYCGKLAKSSSSQAQLKTFKGDFYEILIHLYATTLLSEIRNGLHHEYVTRDQNINYLRGKLLFSQHIKENGITNEKFYVTTDDFVSNTKLNQTFAYVTRVLLRSSSHPLNKRLLGELNQTFAEITPTMVAIDSANKIQVNRLSDRFKPALELAKLFLSGRSLQLSQQSFDTITFLIDMNNLFEDYIGAICRKVAGPETIVHLQGPRQYLVDKHYAENEASSASQLFMMKPDISIAERSSPRIVNLIIDTKYKILDDTQRKLGISQADLYQMYAYSNKYNTQDIVLLYPSLPDQLIPDKTNIIDGNCTIHVRTINLNRDLRLNDRAIKAEVNKLLNLKKLVNSDGQG